MKKISLICLLLLISRPVLAEVGLLRMDRPMSISFVLPLSDLTIEATARAVGYWNKVLGCSMFYFVIGKGDIQMMEVDEYPKETSIVPWPGYQFAAVIYKQFDKKTKYITSAIIRAKKDNIKHYRIDKLESLYRHELGHALGLLDIPKRHVPGLMHPLQRFFGEYPLDAELEDIFALRRIHCGK